MILAASLGYFQTFGFLCPIFEFHNLAAETHGFISQSPLDYLILCALIANVRYAQTHIPTKLSISVIYISFLETLLTD